MLPLLSSPDPTGILQTQRPYTGFSHCTEFKVSVGKWEGWWNKAKGLIYTGNFHDSLFCVYVSYLLFLLIMQGSCSKCDIGHDWNWWPFTHLQINFINCFLVVGNSSLLVGICLCQGGPRHSSSLRTMLLLLLLTNAPGTHSSRGNASYHEIRPCFHFMGKIFQHAPKAVKKQISNTYSLPPSTVWQSENKSQIHNIKQGLSKCILPWNNP